MKQLTLTLSFGLITSFGFSQDYSVNFLKGTRDFEENISTFDPSSIASGERWQDNYYRYLQFNAIPTTDELEEIKSLGIELIEYIPNYTYLASIPSHLNSAQLEQINVRSIQAIEYTYKVSQRIQDKNYPVWSMNGERLKLIISLYEDVDMVSAMNQLKKEGASIELTVDHVNDLYISIDASKADAIAELSFVQYLDVIPEPGEAESDEGRFLHRANAVDGEFLGARNYDGAGVNVAVNDDGYVGPHIDFEGRVNQDDVINDMTGTHGDMVAGIVGGAGNLDPEMRGMATGSYMHIRQYSTSSLTDLSLHQDSSVLVFTSSYSNGCNDGYTNIARQADLEIYNYPTLMQTFSAGNSNGQDCGYGAGDQWGNITGGHKAGKNVIATANLLANDNIVSSSSRGPASDGRIKPDIAAHGNSQMSTDPDNAYAAGGGTSAAAPGIAGVMAQLHHAYRDLNGGTTAGSALLKATLLNTANDLGNDGPDFIYGWGKVNALKAVQLLEDNRYARDTIAQGDTNTISFTIPSGVMRAKIMVYWADKEGSTSSATALVNDLDASVIDPSSGVHMPWLLDHTPNTSSLSAPATTGEDHLNNMEQIAIDNPVAGSYDLQVIGSAIPFGPQEFYVVYEYLTSGINIIYPNGGEGLEPSSTQKIHWDAHTDTLGNFTIEYSADNGTNWSTLTTTLNGGLRSFQWAVPDTITGEALIRVSRGSDSDQSDANFSIVERPENIHVQRICPDSIIVLKWDLVPGATSYDVFMLGQKYMDSIGSSVTDNFNVIVSDLNDPQWFSVRAVGPNGLRSMRQIAIYYPGGFGTSYCALSCVSDNDVGISSITEPASSFETCGGNISSDVVIELENLGLYTESNFPVHYQLDGGTIVTETFTGSLAPGGSASHTFGTQITFPSSGNYELKTWSSVGNDSTSCNDTIFQTITVVNSVGTYPFSEDFETAWLPANIVGIENPDIDLTWSPATVVGASGGQTDCAFINNYAYNAAGEEDGMNIVSFDLSQVQQPSAVLLTFDVAYRRYNSTYSDDMRVDASDDCGQTYSQVYFKDGADLATGSNSFSEWEPDNANDWRNDTIDLSAYIGSEVSVRFVNITGYGNNLYLDNINVEVISTVGTTDLSSFDFSLIPNPATEYTTINFAGGLSEDVQLELLSPDGKILDNLKLQAGLYSAQLNVEGLSSAVYYIRILSSAVTSVKKLVIE